MAKKLKIKVDQDTCIGCCTCAAMCPLYYQMAAHGKAEPAQDTATNQDDFDEIKAAEMACPVDAISVNEE